MAASHCNKRTVCRCSVLELMATDFLQVCFHVHDCHCCKPPAACSTPQHCLTLVLLCVGLSLGPSFNGHVPEPERARLREVTAQHGRVSIARWRTSASRRLCESSSHPPSLNTTDYVRNIQFTLQCWQQEGALPSSPSTRFCNSRFTMGTPSIVFLTLVLSE